MSNIAEGSERGTNKDYVRMLFIARGSAGEVRSLLYVALDQGYVDDDQFKECRDLCIRSCQLIWGLINFLRKSGPIRPTQGAKPEADHIDTNDTVDEIDQAEGG